MPAGAGDAVVSGARSSPEERLIRSAHELIEQNGLSVVGVDRIVASAGVAKTTLYRHFRSRDDLVLAVLERHETLWTREWLQYEVERRAQTPEARLLVVFEVFDWWFNTPDYEGCLFTNVLIETHDRSSTIRMTCVAQLDTIKDLLQTYAAEAGIRDPERVAAQLHILMWGSIVAAVNGRLDAARQARVLAELLLERERADSS